MINVIIPLTEKPEVKNLAEEVRKILPGAFVVVGITESLSGEAAADVVNVFPEKTKVDQMINVLVKEARDGPLIFLKDLRKLSYIKELIVPEKDIVMFRRQKGDIGLYFEDAKDWLAGVFFGFNIYRGDTGALYISEKFAEIMKNLPPVAVSLASRVNRFTGAEIHYIEKDKKDFVKYKPKIDIIKPIAPLFITCFLLAGLSVTLGLFSGFFTKHIWLGVIISFVILLLAVFVCFFVLKLLLVMEVGELIVNEADKITNNEKRKTKNDGVSRSHSSKDS